MRFTDNEKGIPVCEFECEAEKKLFFRLMESHLGLMTKAYRKRNKNWVAVKHMTRHGSGYSEAICKALGVDPDSYTWEARK